MLERVGGAGIAVRSNLRICMGCGLESFEGRSAILPIPNFLCIVQRWNLNVALADRFDGSLYSTHDITVQSDEFFGGFDASRNLVLHLEARRQRT